MENPVASQVKITALRPLCSYQLQWTTRNSSGESSHGVKRGLIFLLLFFLPFSSFVCSMKKLLGLRNDNSNTKFVFYEILLI